MKTNMMVRVTLEEAKIRQWQLADDMKIHESVLCRKLRKELPIEEQRELVTRINKIS